jgi:AraC-like DNA-binding protein
LVGLIGNETDDNDRADISDIGTLEGCDEEAVGIVRQVSRPKKFLIEYMDYYFRRPALRRYHTQARLIEMLDLESIKGVSREHDRGTSLIDAGISIHHNKGKAGELLFCPNVPVRGVRIIVYEHFYKSHPRERFPENLIDLTGPNNLSDMGFSDPETRLVFKQIQRAIERGDNSEIYFESKITELLCLIAARRDKRVLHAQGGRLLSNEDIMVVKKVKTIIEERVSDPPKISELATIFATCAVKLQNDFKSAFGDTIHGYVQKARVSEALSKIENTDESLSTISRNVGCKNPSRFSEIFRKTYGITPGEYRKLKNAVAQVTTPSTDNDITGQV